MAKRIIALFLCIVIISSIFCVDASATIADASKYAIDSFLKWLDYGGHIMNNDEMQISVWWKKLIDDESDSRGGNFGDYSGGFGSYNTYVTGMNTELGTTSLIDGGIRVYFDFHTSTGFDSSSYTMTSGISPSVLGNFDTQTSFSVLQPDGIKVPFHCTATFHCVANTSGCSYAVGAYAPQDSASFDVAKDNYVYARSITFSGNSGSNFSAAWRMYADLIPYSGVIQDNYTTNIAPSTRVTSITTTNNFSYGYKDSSEALHVAPSGTVIVDETNKRVYNPVTGETTSITKWAYDYATRTYTVTTAAGGTITITYGDDAITWNDGTNSYSILYVSASSSSGDSGGGTTTGIDLSIINKWISDTSHAGNVSGTNWNDFMYLFTNMYNNLSAHFQTTFPLFASNLNTKIEDLYNSLGFGNYAEDNVTLKSLLQSIFSQLQTINSNTANGASGSSGSGSSDTGEDGTGTAGSSGQTVSGASGSTLWSKIKNAFNNALGGLIATVFDLVESVLEKILDLLKDLLSFVFDFITDTVLSGISNFFNSFKDANLFSVFRSDQSTGGYTLPEGVPDAFKFMSGCVTSLPPEVSSLLILGVALTVLFSVFKLL